jgi:hypothetical protein
MTIRPLLAPRPALAWLGPFVLALGACSSDGVALLADGGTEPPPSMDASMGVEPTEDAGTGPSEDAGAGPVEDAGTPEDDGGPPADAGVDPLPAPPDWFEPQDPIVTLPEELETWRFIPVDGMICANGQQSGFFANFTEKTEDLVIYLLGGGICYDDASCNLPPHHDMVVNGLGPDPLAFWTGSGESHNGIFARGDEQNPFRDASYVVLPHCTVDFHSANKLSTYAGFDGPIHQVGYRNVQLAMNAVVPTFADPDRNVTIAGFSAGGVGTLANYHQIAQAFESYGHQPPFMINDGGPIQRRFYFSLNSHNAIRNGWGLDDTVGTWCPTCATEGYHETLRYIHALHPGVRSSQICAYADLVVMGLYTLFDAINNAAHFTYELIPTPPFSYTSMKNGLKDLAGWAEGLPSEGMHRNLFYYSDRHGAITVAPLDQTPGLIPFLNAQLNRDDPYWYSVIP